MKVACFVDYSNLLGSLNRLNIKVIDYQEFFKYILMKGSESEKTIMLTSTHSFEARLSRVYWYAVGRIDIYDFEGDFTRRLMERIFDNAPPELRAGFISAISKKNPSIPQPQVHKMAFEAFYEDRKHWYKDRKSSIEKFCGFYDKTRKESDFIDINDSGHWKLNFIAKEVDEKGVDTALAVDSVTMADTYDVAYIVSGDADMIPSIQHIKRRGKHVGMITFISGSPPEQSGRQQSRRLSCVADYDVPIYETDLHREAFCELQNR